MITEWSKQIKMTLFSPLLINVIVSTGTCSHSLVALWYLIYRDECFLSLLMRMSRERKQL